MEVKRSEKSTLTTGNGLTNEQYELFEKLFVGDSPWEKPKQQRLNPEGYIPEMKKMSEYSLGNIPDISEPKSENKTVLISEITEMNAFIISSASTSDDKRTVIPELTREFNNNFSFDLKQPGLSFDVEAEGDGNMEKKERKKKYKRKKCLGKKHAQCKMCKYICAIGETHCVTLHAQELWPKDVKLFQPYEVEQILLPDNANTLAVQAYLKMCNLDFQVEPRSNAEAMSPTGKVPFIKCGRFIVSELEGIVQFVNNKGISLTSDLEEDEKSDMRAYMSVVRNVLENAELYICWCDQETYSQVTNPRNGSVYPWPLNHIQTWSKRSAVIKRLKLLGWFDKTLDEVYKEVESCCQALTDRLEEDYFFGKNGSELDALIYGHVRAILTTALPAQSNELAYKIESFDKLVEHCKRIGKIVTGKDIDLPIRFYKIQENLQQVEALESDVNVVDSVETSLVEDIEDITDITFSEPLYFSEVDSVYIGDTLTDDLGGDLSLPIDPAVPLNTLQEVPISVH